MWEWVELRTVNRGALKEGPEWRCRYLTKGMCPQFEDLPFSRFPWLYIIYRSSSVRFYAFVLFLSKHALVCWTRATRTTHWRYLPFMSPISDGDLSVLLLSLVRYVLKDTHVWLTIPYLYSLLSFSWTLYLLRSFNSSNSFEQHCANPILLFAQASWFTFQIYAHLSSTQSTSLSFSFSIPSPCPLPTITQKLTNGFVFFRVFPGTLTTTNVSGSG